MSAWRCPICNSEDEDRRTISVSCLYAVDEMAPFLRTPDGRYELTVCKQCRGDFLAMIATWFRGAFVDMDLRLGNEKRNIPLRMQGRTLWVTREEYAELYPNRAPITMSRED